MLTSLLNEVNAKGLDLYTVVKKAADLHILRDAHIPEDRIAEVISLCLEERLARRGESQAKKRKETKPAAIKEERKEAETIPPTVLPTEKAEEKKTEKEAAVTLAEEAILEDDPYARALIFAKEISIPLSAGEWNNKRKMYQTHLNVTLPTADEITNQYRTWERFWEGAGFRLETYIPRDIIRLTIVTDNTGCIAKECFDETFPDMPSSSRVLEVFGGNWENYTAAVERERGRRFLPVERIDELLREGQSINEVKKIILKEFGRRKNIDPIFKGPRNELYMLITNRKKRLDADQKSKTLTRKEIKHNYSSLERIASEPIKGLRFYNGARKDEKRTMMAEDIIDYLVKVGAEKRFAYTGLEGVNFKSYINLQRTLEGIIDPKQSLVVECDQETADAMKTIVASSDVIEGGEIFEGLTVEEGFMHQVLPNHGDKRFDILNLDYMDGWSRTKELAMQILFSRGQIVDEALMYVTLLNSGMEKFRVKHGTSANGIVRDGFGTDDQKQLLEDTMKKLCKKYGYDISTLHCDEYFDTQKMLFFGFYLKKKTGGK
ncbi:MAG: hypothetical protein KJ574_00700 [Nanoarchaeota archaeon]|nr:hypothetical protein [Nanoarchaeota archaeon]